MRSEIADLAKSGLTAEELERARAKMIGAEVIRNQSNSALAGVVAADELMGLGYEAHKSRKEQIEKITLDDTRRVAAKYFHTDSSVEAAVMPPAWSLPSCRLQTRIPNPQLTETTPCPKSNNPPTPARWPRGSSNWS